MILKTDASRKRNGMRRFNKTLLNYDACLGNYLEKDVRKKSLCSFSWLFLASHAFLKGGSTPFTPAKSPLPLRSAPCLCAAGTRRPFEKGPSENFTFALF